MNKFVKNTKTRFNIYLIGVSEGEEGKDIRGNIWNDNGQEFFNCIKKPIDSKCTDSEIE